MRKLKSSPRSPEFGLVAWLEQTRVVLPLKGVECRFEITGAVASVELDQIYHQQNAQALDCTYLFPLPAGAAVYRCELLVNGRVIRAIVEEEKAAREIYREKKEAGHRVAMVEQERENLFTLSLGNVQPDDVVVVRLAFFQVLDRLGNALRLLVPTCPGVRYIPGRPLLRSNRGRGTEGDTDQVPDASRITPPRIDELHPDAAYFALHGRLSPGDVASGSATSSSHPVFVRELEGAVTVELADRGEVPDKDFVLWWREPAARTLAPQAWRYAGDDGAYALLQLRAPAEVAVADNVSQDFYFLVDRSGSMQGAKWEQTCRALQGFVALLGAEDRVWITLFESSFESFAEKPLPAPQVAADRKFQQMVRLGTAGGTELLPAAQHVLEVIAQHSRTRTASVVLITDGQVGNDAEIMEAFRRVPHVRVHTFGIDTAVNDALLMNLAKQQRGGCWLQSPNDDIAGTVAALGGRLRRPVIRELCVSAGWEASRPLLPDLHAEEVVLVALRGDGAQPLEVTGLLPSGERHRFAVPLEVPGTSAVQLLWAQERIAVLLAEGRPAEAVMLAKKRNLICDGAIFVAWDEAEKVTVAKHEVVQPALCLEQAAPLQVRGMGFAKARSFRAKSVPLGGSAAPTAPPRVSKGSWGDLGGSDQLDSLDAAPAKREKPEGGRGSGGGARGDSQERFGFMSRQESEVEKRWKRELVPALRSLGFPVEKLAGLEALLFPHKGGFLEAIEQSLMGTRRMRGLTRDAIAVVTALQKWNVEAARRFVANVLVQCPVTIDDFKHALLGLERTLVELSMARERLLQHGAPPVVADALLEWALADGVDTGPNRAALQALLVSLEPGRSPGIPQETAWQIWLDQSVSRESAVYAAARAWRPELAPPGAAAASP